MPYNWSIDEKKLKKNKDNINIDPYKRNFLKLIINGKNTHQKSA